MERSWQLRLLFDKNCTASRCSLSQQGKFLRKFQSVLQTKPARALAQFASFLSSLRGCAASPIVHLEADMRRVVVPHQPWLVWPVGESAPVLPPHLSQHVIKNKLRKTRVKVCLVLVVFVEFVKSLFEGGSYGCGWRQHERVVERTDA
jgi:hypothetical protein